VIPNEEVAVGDAGEGATVGGIRPPHRDLHLDLAAGEEFEAGFHARGRGGGRRRCERGRNGGRDPPAMGDTHLDLAARNKCLRPQVLVPDARPATTPVLQCSCSRAATRRSAMVGSGGRIDPPVDPPVAATPHLVATLPCRRRVGREGEGVGVRRSVEEGAEDPEVVAGGSS
jgi:hypothetical protein